MESADTHAMRLLVVEDDPGKSMRQGEVAEFTAVVDAARHTAFERLADHAAKLGGNAVLGVRFDSSDIGNGLAEIVAYGTAARVTPA